MNNILIKWENISESFYLSQCLTELGITCVETRSDSFYVLDISDEGYLMCDSTMAAKVIYDALKCDDFDVLYLDGFASVGRLYRTNKKGLSSYTIEPPLFNKRLSKQEVNRNRSQSKLTSSHKNLGRQNTNTSNRSLHIAGVLFFTFVFVGGIVVASRNK